MTHFLEISTRDPLIARDGRPFGATQGHRMRSLDWIYPSVAAGMVRTLLGEKNGGTFDRQTITSLKQVKIGGPLPMVASQLFFPAPQDLVAQRTAQSASKRMIWAKRPVKVHVGEGTNLPSYLDPILLSPSAPDFKPSAIPPFWSCAKLTEWLLNSTGLGFHPPPDPGAHTPEELIKMGFLKIEKEERFHVNIEPGTYAARENQLFMTVAIVMPDAVRISLRVEAADPFDSYLRKLDEWSAMGGERRLIRVSAANNHASWTCPSAVKDSVQKTNRIRMILATPALFKDGWKPGWIGNDGKGEFGGVKLRLVGACVERWRPISGWSYEPPRGPKAALRLTPAGSVYFFKTDGDASALADCWLKSVSDFGKNGQPERDGFGLALWGPWGPHES